MVKYLFAALLALGLVAASAVTLISFTSTPSFAQPADCGGSN